MAARGTADARTERGAVDRRVTLVRVYLDGVYGVGKSTTGRVMASSAGRGSPTLYFPEPMAYWRTLFETDVIGGIYETQNRKRAGGLTGDDASLITAHYQSRFATPYLLLHDHTSGLFGSEEMPRGAAAPDLVLVFDRHPVAATVCFPAARYLLGDMPMSALLAMAATLPPEAPGANLVVTTLDVDEHVRRLRARARIGEQVDMQLIATLRNVYAMLVNTSRFLQSGRVWRDGWGQLPPFTAARRRHAAQLDAYREREYPELSDTLFGMFKSPELMDERGVLLEVHSWALDALMGRLRHLRVFSADLGGTPRQCAAAVDGLMPLMSSTVTGAAAAAALERAARNFNAEMGV
ncbi:thymidine kinase [Equid alphaherpesvirus 3]|uniref:Thymidine kinase n=1 Tax=Equid alphaherpesvirus 3 TaxID=80341 RepID=A0A077B9Q8_9ALPH|nr:thymidine kinase [Equid alphaherpesvirus 3]AIL02956.1 thymidine kinase [Equid alphaherpesvirus 3]